MESVKSPQAQKWNTEEAARLAREAYRYVGRTYPLDADLEPLGAADRAVLEALRELCRTARREAQRRAAA